MRDVLKQLGDSCHSWVVMFRLAHNGASAMVIGAIMCAGVTMADGPSGATAARETVSKPATTDTTNAPVPIPLGGPKFITALCTDLAGNLWVGSEDEGVWKLSADALEPDNLSELVSQVATTGAGKPAQSLTKSWTKYTTKDGLGDDNAYALACDKLGRVWIGHLNHGVSVYNGQRWQNYNVVAGLPRDNATKAKRPEPDPLVAQAGPLGPRVFALAVNPLDGDVWIGTDAGLTRYAQKLDTWSYYTRAEGLPADQIAALAFGKDGTIYVGTQCDGLASAGAGDNYRTWRLTSCPKEYEQTVPLTASGSGLPSNLINGLLVTKDGTLFVATTTGLAWSRDRAQSFNFVRGRNYADKVKGLFGGPPKGWLAPGKDVLANQLSEDYITGLEEDADGKLWIAYREAGYQIVDPKTQRQYKSMDDPALSKTDGFISVVRPLSGSDAILARYGGGVSVFVNTRPTVLAATRPKQLEQPKNVNSSEACGALPTGASALTTVEVQALSTSRQKAQIKIPITAYVADDWITQGDWVGRYGRQCAVLCAAGTPTDHLVSWGNEYKVDRHIGPHIQNNDILRGWVHWLSSENPKVLYNPLVQTRRQSEWDDHGEAYSQNYDGPDIWASIEIPAGINTVSLYFFNKDGHTGNNRSRDYVIDLKAFNRDLAVADAAPILARARVKDFWGGVYKQFLVTKPGKYLIRVSRNYSFNAIISAVLVDRIDPFTEKFGPAPAPGMVDVLYGPPEIPVLPEPHASEAVLSLWSPTGMTIPANELDRMRAVLALRAAQELPMSPERLSAWRWHLRIWNESDRTSFDKTMALGRKAAAWQESYNAVWAKYYKMREAGVKGPIKIDIPEREKDEP